MIVNNAVNAEKAGENMDKKPLTLSSNIYCLLIGKDIYSIVDGNRLI